MGGFRKLLFGTVPESAAPARRRQRRRRTESVEPKADQKTFASVFSSQEKCITCRPPEVTEPDGTFLKVLPLRFQGPGIPKIVWWPQFSKTVPSRPEPAWDSRETFDLTPLSQLPAVTPEKEFLPLRLIRQPWRHMDTSDWRWQNMSTQC